MNLISLARILSFPSGVSLIMPETLTIGSGEFTYKYSSGNVSVVILSVSK
jgi:hypothetical protein